MANISIKKDFEDGQKLFAQQLNNNFETIELGINAGNKLIWKDDNGAEFQTFRGTTEEIKNRPIIDGQTLYNIETGEMLLDTEGSRRTMNKPLWNGNSTSEVTSFRGTTAEVSARPIIDGQKLYDIENGDTFLDVGETRKVMNKPLWNGNGAQVQSFRGTAAEVAARPIIDGQTLYNIETGETALDVGGKRISTGAGNVVYIGDEEPQNDATKIWIENDQVLNLGSEVAISSEEPTTQEKLWLQKGKNLFDSNTLVAGDIRGGYPDLRVSSRQKLWLKAGTYTVSTNLSNSYQFVIQIQNVTPPPTIDYPTYIYDSSWVSGGVKTFTTTQDGWFLLGVRKADNTNFSLSEVIGFNYQLEYGDISTSYEPYTPKKIHTKTDNGYEEFYNEENREVYSTSEQRIGTWIDGKPLYRRVIETGILTTSEATVANIPNIQVKMIHGWLFKDDGTVQNYGQYMNSEGTYTSRIFYSANVIKVQQGTTFQNKDYKARIVVEYTKTTD